MKRIRGRIRAVAAVALAFAAVLMSKKAIVYGMTPVSVPDAVKRMFGGCSYVTMPGTARSADRDTTAEERNKDRTDDFTAGMPIRSYVWTVVVGLVLLAAGFAKIDDHFYRKHKKNEEDKAKGRMVL